MGKEILNNNKARVYYHGEVYFVDFKDDPISGAGDYLRNSFDGTWHFLPDDFPVNTEPCEDEVNDELEGLIKRNVSDRYRI